VKIRIRIRRRRRRRRRRIDAAAAVIIISRRRRLRVVQVFPVLIRWHRCQDLERRGIDVWRGQRHGWDGMAQRHVRSRRFAPPQQLAVQRPGDQGVGIGAATAGAGAGAGAVTCSRVGVGRG